MPVHFIDILKAASELHFSSVYLYFLPCAKLTLNPRKGTAPLDGFLTFQCTLRSITHPRRYLATPEPLWTRGTSGSVNKRNEPKSTVDHDGAEGGNCGAVRRKEATLSWLYVGASLHPPLIGSRRTKPTSVTRQNAAARNDHCRRRRGG